MGSIQRALSETLSLGDLLYNQPGTSTAREGRLEPKGQAREQRKVGP